MNQTKQQLKGKYGSKSALTIIIERKRARRAAKSRPKSAPENFALWSFLSTYKFPVVEENDALVELSKDISNLCV
jgi:hypothetical protein